MLRSSRALAHAASWRNASKPSICCFCDARSKLTVQQRRPFSATESLRKRRSKRGDAAALKAAPNGSAINSKANPKAKEHNSFLGVEDAANDVHDRDATKDLVRKIAPKEEKPMSLKEALTGAGGVGSKKGKRPKPDDIHIEQAAAEDFNFEPIDVQIPPVPMLAYGLDRVLFNPGVYRLQDPRTGIYNFDPYLEKIMPVDEFDFDALAEYKTSSKDETLLAITRDLGVKYTGSTSSMSGVLQHFHFLLSAHRRLNHSMLSKDFPEPSNKLSRITTGPDAIFLRYKDGVYAIDADKSYDTPNIMSWLGHSMEKLLTSERNEFERYRRSNPEETPPEGDSARCFHYSRQGSMLMRSQLDARDPRLPGAGIFDLKTRAVVSIRMNHKDYEQGLGYQLRFGQGQWESFEREFYDMTRATMLKYSLQVRMGRMDGIFLAYHNIERIFGFQYMTLSEMDHVLHGQTDTCLGDQEFRMSLGLKEKLLEKATAKFPETSIRLHFETRDVKNPFMYVFAEPVSEERADEIQSTGVQAGKEWARRVVGVGKNDSEAKEEWQDLQEEVDEQVSEDSAAEKEAEPAVPSQEVEAKTATDTEAATTEADTSPSLSAAATEESTVDDTASSTQSASSAAEEPTTTTIASSPRTPPAQRPSGPLAGWVVTIRNKVNGQYVTRPENLESEDNWAIEYHMREIAPDEVWALYNKTLDRRHALIGQDDEHTDQRLESYRKVIQRYASRGRKWRTQQDAIDEQRGVGVFKPLGPGTEEYREMLGRAGEESSE